jgi:predicted ATPase/DNA-binding SARP family transcriptional activator
MSPRLALYFLGAPQLYLDNAPIPAGRRKVVALLAYLAIERGSHRRESLSALLWPDYDQSKAFTNLRHTLWETQKSVGEGWLLTDYDKIGLNEAANVWLDLRQFESLLAQSRAERDLPRRISLLVESTKLYRNHFLTGFSLKDAPNFNEWAFAESEDVRCQLAGALTSLSEDYCALGRAEQAIPYARRIITLDPLNESAHRRLMNIYVQVGQQTAALKQYQMCEEILRKELNLDPQPETYALYKKIRKGETKLVQVTKTSELLAPRYNLPHQLTSFIGREKEQKEIADLLTNHRLVTLTGAGGIGKTRLSIQVAPTVLNKYPNGTWLVELAPLSDPGLVPQTVASTLGLIEQAGRSPLMILIDFLQAKRALLILDNCEHLIQACAQLAETLLRNCPNLHILATSREALGIAGEMLYLIPPLSIPDRLHTTLDALLYYEAVQLFVERAQTVLQGFSLTSDNALAIIQVCQQLDGIPLALELAAARVKVLRVKEIAARLVDRFHLLTGGLRTALPRHQTLQSMIDWSYDLLYEPERILLRRLSVFAGDWSLEAAESICGGRGIEAHEILDLLTQLLNKSLIIVDRRQGQETRYQMLETIRQYGREKLRKAGEGETMRQRHLAYFVDLTERAEPNLRAFDMVMWLDQLEAEQGNIRAALEWAQENDVEAQLRLASALLWFWHIRGHGKEGIDWLERGLSIEAQERGDQTLMPIHAMIRGKALNVSGILMGIYFEVGKATERLQEGLALFQELGSAGKLGMAHALRGLGGLPSAGDQALLEQSLSLSRELGDRFGIAQCLMSLAGIAKDNDHIRALKLATEHLALRREIGDQDGIAMALESLGELVFGQAEYQRAIALFEESLTGFRAVKNKWAIGFTLSIYGDACLWQGDYDRATSIYEESLSFAQDIGDRFLIAFNSYSLGIITWHRGDYVRANQMITDSLTVFRDGGPHWLVASSLHALADIAFAQGDEQRATQWYEAELAMAQETQYKVGLIFALDGLGKVAWARRDYGLAAEKLEEGLKISQVADLKPATFHALYGLGRVAQSRSDYAAARRLYREALEILRQRTDQPFYWVWLKTYRAVAAYPISALAILAVPQNQMERATKLLSAAETLYTPLRFVMSAIERAEHDHALAVARAEMGEKAFAVASEEGKKMSLDEAVAYAIERD